VKKKIICLLQLVVIFSCSNTKKEKEFLDVFGHESFNQFVNKAIYIRGGNENGDLIIFFNNDLSTAASCGPFIIIVDDKKQIKSIDGKLKKCSNHLDTVELRTLTNKFLDYHIKMLKVDNDHNVFIGINDIERPELVRYARARKMIGTDWRRLN
jgi:hypothetical protein